MWMQFAHPCNLSPYADCDYSVGTNFHVERWAPVTINAWDRTKKTNCLAYSSTRRQKNYRNCLLLLNTSLPFEIKGIIVDTWIVHSSLKKNRSNFFFFCGFGKHLKATEFLKSWALFCFKNKAGTGGLSDIQGLAELTRCTRFTLKWNKMENLPFWWYQHLKFRSGTLHLSHLYLWW